MNVPAGLVLFLAIADGLNLSFASEIPCSDPSRSFLFLKSSKDHGTRHESTHPFDGGVIASIDTSLVSRWQRERVRLRRKAVERIVPGLVQPIPPGI